MKLIFLGTGSAIPSPDRNCQSIAIEVDGFYYIFDGGAPIAELLAVHGIAYEKVKAIFVSHIHRDHTSGLLTFLCIFSTYYQDRELNIFSPRKSWSDALVSLIAETAPDRKYNPDILNFHLEHEGELYADEQLKVTAYPTRHQQHIDYPSYAYCIEAGAQRIIITGDLLSDASDFPQVAFKEESDVLVTELHHFGPDSLFPILETCPTKRAFIIHIDACNRNEYEAQLRTLALDYPVSAPVDGEIFEL